MTTPPPAHGQERPATITPIRVGLIGAGGIAPSHLEAWQRYGADVAIHSASGAQALAERYGVDAAADLDELLHRVDVVDIVTPTATHRDLALAAIGAGRHVICEKPLGKTSSDAREIVRAADAAGLHVYPAHVVRYFPEYAAIKAAVDSGRIGTPAVLRLSRAGQGPRVDSWFFDETVGGGIFLDQMVHDLDQARWLLGSVTEVFALQNPPSVRGRVPPIVAAHAVLTHASGAISHVQGFWGPVGLTFRTSIHLAGSLGTVSYRSPDDGALESDLPAAPTGGDYLPPKIHAVSPFDREIAELADAIRGGPAPRVAAADGVIAVALAEAAMRSARSQRPVSFDAAAALGTDCGV